MRKSINDGDDVWQIANDCLEAVADNSNMFVSSIGIKAATTEASGIIKCHRWILDYQYLSSKYTGGVSYLLSAINCINAIDSVYCSDPLAKADFLNYVLK